MSPNAPPTERQLAAIHCALDESLALAILTMAPDILQATNNMCRLTRDNGMPDGITREPTVSAAADAVSEIAEQPDTLAGTAARQVTNHPKFTPYPDWRGPACEAEADWRANPSLKCAQRLFRQRPDYGAISGLEGLSMLPNSGIHPTPLVGSRPDPRGSTIHAHQQLQQAFGTNGDGLAAPATAGEPGPSRQPAPAQPPFGAATGLQPTSALQSLAALLAQLPPQQYYALEAAFQQWSLQQQAPHSEPLPWAQPQPAPPLLAQQLTTALAQVLGQQPPAPPQLVTPVPPQMLQQLAGTPWLPQGPPQPAPPQPFQPATVPTWPQQHTPLVPLPNQPQMQHPVPPGSFQVGISTITLVPSDGQPQPSLLSPPSMSWLETQPLHFPQASNGSAAPTPGAPQAPMPATTPDSWMASLLGLAPAAGDAEMGDHCPPTNDDDP